MVIFSFQMSLLEVNYGVGCKIVMINDWLVALNMFLVYLGQLVGLLIFSGRVLTTNRMESLVIG